MSAERIPMDDTPASGEFSYSPEHLSYLAGGTVTAGNLAGDSYHSNNSSGSGHSVQALAKKTLELGEVDDLKKTRGRPAFSGNVRVRPIFRTPPDLAKIGRAVIAQVSKMNASKAKTEIVSESESETESETESKPTERGGQS